MTNTPKETFDPFDPFISKKVISEDHYQHRKQMAL